MTNYPAFNNYCLIPIDVKVNNHADNTIQSAIVLGSSTHSKSHGRGSTFPDARQGSLLWQNTNSTVRIKLSFFLLMILLWCTWYIRN